MEKKTMETNEETLHPASSEEQGEETKRTYISLQAKIELVMKAERLVRAEKCMSIKAFCRQYDIQPSQLRRWEKNIVTMKKTLEGTKKRQTKSYVQQGKFPNLNISGTS